MGFVLALISSAAFGLIPLFSLPLLHSGLSADCVLFYRFLFASVSLGLILVLRQERLAAPARDLGLLALFSVLYALAALLMIWGLLYLSGGVTATLQFLYPLMVMLIMTILGRHLQHRPTSRGLRGQERHLWKRIMLQEIFRLRRKKVLLI